jgi:hypothetical protein
MQYSYIIIVAAAIRWRTTRTIQNLYPSLEESDSVVHDEDLDLEAAWISCELNTAALLQRSQSDLEVVLAPHEAHHMSADLQKMLFTDKVKDK